MADKRRKTVTTTYADDNTGMSFALHTRPDDTGAQSVAERVDFAHADIHPSLHTRLALIGVGSLFANAYNKLDNPDASEVRAAYDRFIASIKDGTWTPGRVFESEPTDLELALAEATQKPVHVVQKWMEDQLALVKHDEAGNPVTNKAGRVVHVHRRSEFLEKIADDPRVKPILARLMRERAARLAAEARTHKGGEAAPDTFGGLFDQPSAEAAQ